MKKIGILLCVLGLVVGLAQAQVPVPNFAPDDIGGAEGWCNAARQGAGVAHLIEVARFGEITGAQDWLYRFLRIAPAGNRVIWINHSDFYGFRDMCSAYHSAYYNTPNPFVRPAQISSAQVPEAARTNQSCANQ